MQKTINSSGLGAGQVVSKRSMPMLFVLILVLLALIVGYGVGTTVAGKRLADVASQQADVAYQRGFETAWSEARTKVAASPLFPQTAPEITSVNGTVAAVGDDYLEVETIPIILNPLEEQAPVTRRVRVAATTTIMAASAKPDSVIQQEFDAFIQAQQQYSQKLAAGEIPGESPPIAPTPLEETAMTLSEIKTGMVVTVTAASNILRAASFDAVKIRVDLSASVAPFSPTP